MDFLVLVKVLNEVQALGPQAFLLVTHPFTLRSPSFSLNYWSPERGNTVPELSDNLCRFQNISKRVIFKFT